MWALRHTLHEGTVPDARAAWHEVLRHIERVLNTRCGQALSARHYGLIGGGEHVAALLQLLPHSQKDIERLVVHTITAHEPRLSQIRLRAPSWVGGQFMRLHIAGVRTQPLDQNLVAFVVALTPLGRCSVHAP